MNYDTRRGNPDIEGDPVCLPDSNSGPLAGRAHDIPTCHRFRRMGRLVVPKVSEGEKKEMAVNDDRWMADVFETNGPFFEDMENESVGAAVVRASLSEEPEAPIRLIVLIQDKAETIDRILKGMHGIIIEDSGRGPTETSFSLLELIERQRGDANADL